MNFHDFPTSQPWLGNLASASRILSEPSADLDMLELLLADVLPYAREVRTRKDVLLAHVELPPRGADLHLTALV